MARKMGTTVLVWGMLAAAAAPAWADGAGKVAIRALDGEWSIKARLRTDDERHGKGKVQLRREPGVAPGRTCLFSSFQGAYALVNLTGFQADGSCLNDGDTVAVPARLSIQGADHGKGHSDQDTLDWSLTGDADSAGGLGSFDRGDVRVVDAGPAWKRHDRAVARLYRKSKDTPEMQFSDGLPANSTLRVAVAGDDPVERAATFLALNKQAYYLADADVALGVRRQVHDSASDTDIVHFYETWKGLPVHGADLAVHLHGAFVTATTGNLLVTPLHLVARPSLSVAEAEDAARAFAGTAPGTPVAGTTTLMVHDPALNGAGARDPHLAWRVMIGSAFPQQVFVEAHTGALLEKSFLGEDAFEMELNTANNLNSGGDSGCYWLTTDDDVIGDETGITDPLYNADTDATNAISFFEGTYNFYKDNYEFDSYDNDGNTLDVYVHARITDENGVVAPNAMFQSCFIGLGYDELFDFSDGYVASDVVTHEFTHGVNRHGADFNRGGFTGAINESLSDIQAYVQDGDPSIGEDAPGPAFRNLQYPARSHVAFYYYGTEDNGGVHRNADITNHAAYLFTMGGTHSFSNVYVPAAAGGAGLLLTGDVFHHASLTLPSNAGAAALRTNALDYLSSATFDPAWVVRRETALCSLRNAFGAVGVGEPDPDCAGPNPDPDGDGVRNVPYYTDEDPDNCPETPNASQSDHDGDGLGDACDPDGDDDGVPNDPAPGFPNGDNCDFRYNPDQADGNFNGIGSYCDPLEDGDLDDDGVADKFDNCRFDANPDQADVDGDGWGDACDPDGDSDGDTNDEDNCIDTPNPDQLDTDGDGLGDACDLCPFAPDGSVAWSYYGDPLTGKGVSKPIVPDADNDGVPDACDGNNLGRATIGGFERTTGAIPDGASRSGYVTGVGGTGVALGLPSCVGTCPKAPVATGCLSVRLDGLSSQVHAFVTDDRGMPAGSAPNNSTTREIRVQPRGGRSYQINFALSPSFSGYAPFTVTATDCTVGDRN